MLCEKHVTFKTEAMVRSLFSRCILVHPPRLAKFKVKKSNKFSEESSRPVASLELNANTFLNYFPFNNASPQE